MFLHFTYFGFSLSYIADFSNTGARASTSAGHILFTRAKSDAVWTSSLSVSHGNLSLAVFLFSPIEATLKEEQQ